MTKREAGDPEGPVLEAEKVRAPGKSDIERPVALGPGESYATVFSLASHLYDFKLKFGLKTEQDEPEQVVAVVHLSPTLAKVVSAIIRKHVSQYEERFGQLPVPDLLIKELDLEGYL